MASHPNTLGRPAWKAPLSCPAVQLLSSSNYFLLFSARAVIASPVPRAGGSSRFVAQEDGVWTFLTWHMISNSSTDPPNLAVKHSQTQALSCFPLKKPKPKKPVLTVLERSGKKNGNWKCYSSGNCLRDIRLSPKQGELTAILKLAADKNRNSHHKLLPSAELFCLCLLDNVLSYI